MGRRCYCIRKAFQGPAERGNIEGSSGPRFVIALPSGFGDFVAIVEEESPFGTHGMAPEQAKLRLQIRIIPGIGIGDEGLALAKIPEAAILCTEEKKPRLRLLIEDKNFGVSRALPHQERSAERLLVRPMRNPITIMVLVPAIPVNHINQRVLNPPRTGSPCLLVVRCHVGRTREQKAGQAYNEQKTNGSHLCPKQKDQQNDQNNGAGADIHPLIGLFKILNTVVGEVVES